MLSRPPGIEDGVIARAVAAHWLPEVADVRHLLWGFGAHHWRVVGDGLTLFATWDQLGARHTASSLGSAYAAAAALATAGLDVVCAPLPATTGRFTVEVRHGALSVTPWLEGRTPTEAEAARPEHARRGADAVNALHRARPPEGLPHWSPRVSLEFAEEVRAHRARPWTSGPLGERARRAIIERQAAIARWTSRYHELAELARSRRELWVPTHGEPHHANQVVTAGGVKLVDWESLALAPCERDAHGLLGTGVRDDVDLDAAMLELFALDWRLSEIEEYVRWFATSHTGDDDRTALAGLHEELSADPG